MRVRIARNSSKNIEFHLTEEERVSKLSFCQVYNTLVLHCMDLLHAIMIVLEKRFVCYG